MAQPNEVINLVIAFIALPFLIAAGGRRHFNKGRLLFLGAYALLLVGLVATVAEGFMAETFFNDVEHLSYALSGLAFAVSIFWLGRSMRREEVR